MTIQVISAGWGCIVILDALIRGRRKSESVGVANDNPAKVANDGRVMTEGADPDPLWWRISITEPGARTVEVDTPSGLTLAEWRAYAERYHSPGCAVTPIAGLPKPRVPVNLDDALAAACEGAGITSAVFRLLLSTEDIKDIEAGAIHPKTLKAYALSFAEGRRSGIAALPETREAKLVPLGGSIVITEAEIEAARKGRTVVRQGDFTGAPEVEP
jgi:hypothetical protein